jgi:hypothetical protein
MENAGNKSAAASLRQKAEDSLKRNLQNQVRNFLKAIC